MLASRAFALRSTFRAACRQPLRSRLTRSLGRRGYASVQRGPIKLPDDMPWLITSVVITVPCAIYLASGGVAKPKHVGTAEEKAEKQKQYLQDKRDKRAAKEHAAEPTTEECAEESPEESTEESIEESTEESKEEPSQETTEVSKEEGAKEEDNKSDDSGNSDDDAPPTPSESDNEDHKTLDDSHESQAEKLTDKPDSKRVDPTEK